MIFHSPFDDVYVAADADEKSSMINGAALFSHVSLVRLKEKLAIKLKFLMCNIFLNFALISPLQKINEKLVK